MVENSYEIWNREGNGKGKEKNINRDKRMEVKEEPLINPSTVFCIDGVQLDDEFGFVGFGNAAGICNFYLFKVE